MKRRHFIQSASIIVSGGITKPVKLTAGDTAGKTSIVGIGASGARLAKAVAGELPYQVNHHTIASENSTELQGKNIVNCWYQTQLQSHFLADTDNYEKLMAEDWAYNMNSPYFQANLWHIQNRVIVVAGLGRTTGSYVSVQLIKELLKRIPVDRIEFVGTLPFKFASGKFKYNLAHQCLDEITKTGVKMTIHNFETDIKSWKLNLNKCYAEMDKMLITSLKSLLNQYHPNRIL